MDPSAPDTEAELERFREQWRAEVARNKRPEPAEDTRNGDSKAPRRKDITSQNVTGLSAARRKDVQYFSEEVEPRAYHDLPDKEELLKLGAEGRSVERNPIEEPSSALEHYERAVEKETQGQLGDSIKHYRKAFKVHLPNSFFSFIVCRKSC